MQPDSLVRSPLVGRTREFDSLRVRLESSCAGMGGLVLLAGEPGIGKTRLAEELAAIAPLHGARVLWGRCYEGEGAPAFWPWVQALRSYVRESDPTALRAELGVGASDIAQIVPEIRERLPDLDPPSILDSVQARFQLFDAVTTFLCRASASRPLLLILDDLHWADTPSLLLLRFLARELSAAHLLVIGTYRDMEVDRSHPLMEALAQLAREPICQRIPLRGLDEPEVGKVVAYLAGFDPPPEIVASLRNETEGNPFFITEVVRLMAANLRLPTESVTSQTLVIPPNVRDAIELRLRRLSAGCMRILTIAAVMGRQFSLDALGQVGELAGEPLLEILEEAETARILTAGPGAPGWFRFAHALIREVLYDSLPVTRRVRLHRQVGLALEAHYAHDLEPHVAELAHHFLQAVPAGEIAKALAYSRRAGDRAMALLAYEEAAAHYARALSLVDRSAGEDSLSRCDLLLALGDAQSCAGDRNAARASFSEAAALARDRGAAHHLARAAVGYGSGGVQAGLVDDTLIALLEEAIDALHDEESPLRVRLLARLAMELYWSDARERRMSLSAEAVALGRRMGDAAALAFALSARHLAFWEPENIAERLAIGEEHLQAAALAGDRQALLEGYARRIPDLLQAGNVPAAEQAIARHAQLASELRQPIYQWDALRFRALTAYLHGRFDEMEQVAREALALAERAQIGGADVIFVSQLQFLRREQGRYAEMEAPINELMTRYPYLRDGWRGPITNLYAQTGRASDARREIDALAATGFDAVGRNMPTLGIMALLTEAIAAVGDAQAAALLYERLQPYAEHYIVNATSPNFYGAAAHYLGMLAATMGHWEAAHTHFEAALRLNLGTRVPSHIVATQVEYAKALLAVPHASSAADLPRARELLNSALAGARALGMRRVEEQILQLQREGEKQSSVPVEPATRTAGSAEGLTPREKEVLALLAGGLSNQEIADALVITVNTVEVHLTRIYDKLGVRGRSAATAYAFRNGLA